MEKFCRVAINAPLKKSVLTYAYDLEIQVGDLVQVPLGRRSEKGVVLEAHLKKEDLSREELKYDLKSVKENLDFSLDKEELDLYLWMAKYYRYSPGKLILESIPKKLKRPRELSVLNGEGAALEYSLTDDQEKITSNIKNKLNKGFSQHLIHGVTGSGKSTIYLELMKEVLEQKKSVLFLVPEINLTPQFLKTFSLYLDCPIYTYHSSVSASQKFQLWNLSKKKDEAFLLIGVRSSIFVPMSNLGLIIVDEEHDSSFKQDDRCRYNARDVAIKKASLLKCPVVLGSATPTLESFSRFHQTESYYPIKDRAVSQSILPKVEVLDATDNTTEESWPIHINAIKKIEERLEKKEQVLVFINRLGFSRYVQCTLCKHQFMCPNCSVSLTYFKNKNHLHCQYCNYTEPMPKTCPDCGSLKFFHKGFGTQRVLEVLENYFPDKNIKRFDRDELGTFNSLTERLDEFHEGKIDVLVGTQMLSKGHNFKRVNLVLILGIDNQLNFPDFRSQEKVYQQLVQVSGRAGRYSDEGEVLVQSFHPESDLFKWIKERSFNDFYLSEAKMRKALEYPPYTYLGVVYFHSRFESRLIDSVSLEANRLRSFIRKTAKEVELMGPTPAMIEKKVNKYTWYFILKAKSRSDLHQVILAFEENVQSLSGVEIKIDIDPSSLN